MNALDWLISRRSTLGIAVAATPVDVSTMAHPSVLDDPPFPSERHSNYCGFCGFKPDRCWGEVW